MKRKFKLLQPLMLVLLVLGAALPAAAVPPSVNPDSVIVDLDVDDVPLRAALQQLVEQSKADILYSDALVAGVAVSCRCQKVTLRQALIRLLQPTPLTFRVLRDGQIVIVKRDDKRGNTVKGYIRDAMTGETLPYANIVVQGSQRGTASNRHGYFVLVQMPAGLCSLRVNYIGYLPQTVPLTVDGRDEMLDIRLQQTALTVEGVTVTAENRQMLEVADHAAEIRLSPREAAALPAIGEVDLFRSLQLLPGISGSSDGSSGLYIRGGTPDENLVLFDGMTIYHVDHLFGFISAFNAEAIKDVRVFKGGYPAKFGGRTSSVVELTGKSGSFEHFQASGSVNLLSGSALVQIPFAGKGAWLMSLRRSYTDVLKSGLYGDIYQALTGSRRAPLQPGQQEAAPGQREGLPAGAQQQTLTPDFYYYDFTSKLTLAPAANNLLSLSLYSGRDDLDRSQELGSVRLRQPGQGMPGGQLNAAAEDVTAWGNRGASIAWTRLWSDRLTSTLLGAYSRYTSESRSGLSAGNAAAFSRIFTRSDDNAVDDWSLRWDTEWQMNRNHRIEAGLWLANTRTQLLFTRNDSIRVLQRDEAANQSAFYLQDTWKPLPKLAVTLGLRATLYSPLQQLYAEPRASLRLALTPKLALKGAWGVYHQFVNRITNDEITEGSRDFWLLAGDHLPPSKATHYILGFSYQSRDVLFDVEAYSKELDGVTEFSQRFRRAPDLEAGPLFFTGTGIARGIEFLAQKKYGAFTGWASYTLAGVDYRIFPFNDGEAYPANQDRRHEVKLAVSYQLNKWRFAATWVYSSGAPYTAPESQYALTLLDGSSRSYIQVGERNAYRLPAYHRLDLSFTRTFVAGSLICDAGLSIFNLYNRTNVWYRQFELDTSPLIVRDVTTLGFTPTLSLKVSLK